MNNPLSKLIALRSDGAQIVKRQEDGPNVIDVQYYYDNGYESAITASGASVVLSQCLDDIYEKFKAQCRDDSNEQLRLSAPYKAERNRQKTALTGRETLKSIKEEELEAVEKGINKIDDDIANVRNNPEQYGIDAVKKPKAQFFIGLSIIIPITFYLIVFYISASYSGFFRVIDNTEVFAAIFDANALIKAINDGWLEAVFVCTIPFVFMGLGYLIHMFLKSKQYGIFKVIGVMLVTFVFDAILAYQIEQKIYDFSRTLTSPDFNMSIAVRSVEFWGIIFAGFVVYVIWGLVFDFVMKEHDSIDKIKVFVNKSKDEKKNLQQRKEVLNNTINDIKHDISQIQGKISELQSRIDGFIFPNRKYLQYHAEYLKGWYMAIAAELAIPHNKKESLLQECKDAADEHLERHNIKDEDSEQVIYTTTFNKNS